MLFYAKKTTSSGLVGYIDVIINLIRIRLAHKPVIIFYNDTTISWHSTKQMLVATSTNQWRFSLFIKLKKSVWLRSVILHMQNTCHLTLVTNYLTWLYEDNATYVAQVRGGYINEIKPNISRWNFSILMNSKKVDKLMLNKFAPSKILQTIYQIIVSINIWETSIWH